VQKYLIVSFNYPPTIGGIETYAKELNSYFNDDKEVVFIHPKIKMSANPFIRGLSLIFFILKTLIKLLFKKYELVHLTSFNLWILGYFYSKFNKKSKIFINIWGLEFVYKNKPGVFPRIYKKIFLNQKLLNSKNFYYVVSSEASRKLMLENDFLKNKIKFIKLGVSDVQLHSSIPKTQTENYFLFVGRIIERKGLSWFAQKILPHFPDFKLKVVGPIGDIKEFERSKVDQVEYLGTVSDLDLLELRKNATICIVPNIYLPNDDDFEAFCFVTIESVASGSIVVASNYQGIPEALLGGQLGYLAEPSDIDSWIKQIKYNVSLSDTQRLKVINERMQKLKEEMSWSVLFKQTKDTYKEIVENVE